MAKGPGGRPPNAWTNSRRRKLTRLYTLTNLSIGEIQSVLEEQDFNPKSRDIQKRLRSLFPKDYAKHHRSYRPKNDENMKMRISIIRSVQQLDSSRTTETHSVEELSTGVKQGSENLLGLSSSKVSSFEQHRGVPQPILSEGIQLSDLEKEMLDAFPPPHHPPSAQNIFLNDDMSADSTPNPRPSVDTLSRRLQNRSLSYVQEVHSILTLSSTNSYISSSLGSASSWGSGLISRGSVRSKLSNVSNSSQMLPRPPDPQSHQRPSNLAQSIISKVKATLSKAEQDVWDEIIDDTQFLPHVPMPPKRPAYNEIALCQRPCCYFLVPYARGEAHGIQCYHCGFTRIHHYARQGLWSHKFPLLNQTDFFGNTPLHYAAASENSSLLFILGMIENGADVQARNTSGETFLHVLKFPRLRNELIEGVPDYIVFLRKLKELNFPFQARNVHGQTVTHTALEYWNAAFSQLGPLDTTQKLMIHLEALELMSANLSAVDNHGYKPGDDGMLPVQLRYVGLDPKHDLMETQEDLRMILDKFRSPRPIEHINFRAVLSSATATYNFKTWFESLHNTTRLISWIDIHGDSPLTAILKIWRARKGEDHEEKLRDIVLQVISMGCSMDLRDRKGYTALAIASIRGSRLIVEALLGLGANPNTRSYKGVSTLSQVSKRMRFAQREGNDKCYTRLLSCINLLVDNGAQLKPMLHDFRDTYF
ncbi:hypothetical protein G7Y89_g12752 [Cudoniella acicularis]|uniref:Ankyrin n=1 Tax=Cudoniella acicularis TaxID=354080 RepID=A0A8H4RC13_9HELO|nr:hypothetical protein G7Y89_g12752 [Cudoniella acicularis]